jgi:RNA polymerase sigma factor (sigma-70 family)
MLQTPSGKNDLTHWNAMIHGSEEAFEKIYTAYFKILYNYGRKICSDPTFVEDAIHDLFVDLWRLRGNLSSTTSVRFYLYRSLRRRLVRNSSQRTQIDVQEFAAEVIQSSHSCEYNIIESETHDHQVRMLKKILNDLSPRQYEALVLFYYDEFSYDEIAGIMSVNAQSARNLVQRGLLQLRHYASHIMNWAIFFSLLSDKIF